MRKDHINHKSHREVFVGNLPQEGIATDVLRQTINAALHKVHPNGLESPIANIRTADSKRFVFLEMHSPEDANLAIKYLDGMPFGSMTLKANRPTSWIPATDFSGTQYTAETALLCSNGVHLDSSGGPFGSLPDANGEQSNKDTVAALLREAMGGS